METNDRLRQLLEFYREDPNDAFTTYALATEYLKIDTKESLMYYEKLLAEHPNYVGTYYHAAKLYIDLGRPEDADKIYQKGLKISRQEGNMHAFSELQQAYNKFKGLDYEDEDGTEFSLTLTWIHPDFNEEFCHFYDDTPEDLPLRASRRSNSMH